MHNNIVLILCICFSGYHLTTPSGKASVIRHISGENRGYNEALDKRFGNLEIDVGVDTLKSSKSGFVKLTSFCDEQKLA